MAQHLWESVGAARCCEVCMFVQTRHDGAWLPPISPICAGDDDDGQPRRRRGPKPLPPSAPELPRGSGDPPGEFAAQIMALLDEYRAAGLTRDWPYPPRDLVEAST